MTLSRSRQLRWELCLCAVWMASSPPALAAQAQPPALAAQAQPPALAAQAQPPALAAQAQPPALAAQAQPPAPELATQQAEPAAPWPIPRIHGLVQIDASLMNQASVDEVDPGSGTALNENRFVLRRARLMAEIERGYVRGYVSLEANSLSDPPLRVHGAEVALGYPADAAPFLLAAGGLMLVPFGFGLLEPDAERLFLEPAQWVNALFPGRRDLGVRAEAQFRFLRAVIAVMNGEPSTAAFPVHDPNAAKDVVARLTVTAPIRPALQIVAGASLLLGTGFHRGRPQTKDSLVWRDANEDGVAQLSEIQVIGGTAAEASRNFARYGLMGDLVASARLPALGHFRLLAEVVWAKNLDRGLWPADPVAAGRGVRELACSFAVQQQLTRHAELGVRYEYYDPDFDANEREAIAIVPVDAAFTTLTLTAAWRSFEPGRLSVEYAHRTNPLGRSSSGTPTTLASDSLVVRAQLAF